MKAKFFFWVAAFLALPVLYFYLDSTIALLFLLVISGGLIYATKVKKVKLNLAISLFFAAVFCFFLLGNIRIANHSSIFISTSAFDMGIIQTLFLRPVIWFAALGLYSLTIYYMYNYQTKIKPRLIIIIIPFALLLFFALMSVKVSADFITGYLSY